jgi:hypothetical protein
MEPGPPVKGNRRKLVRLTDRFDDRPGHSHIALKYLLSMF